MGRIMAIDYGLKRTGLAVTDSLRIIATALDTVPTATLLAFIQDYAKRETIDEFIIGLPKTLLNEDSELAPHVRKFAEVLKAAFSETPIHFVDERFTSKMAMNAMIAGGMKKKDRRVKGNVDKISATIILQSFLETKK